MSLGKSPRKEIKVFLTDVDGTLTDGGYYVSTSMVMKKYKTKDFVGMFMLHETGVRIGIVTGDKDRDSLMAKLGSQASYIDDVDIFTGINCKEEAGEELINRYGIEWDDIAYIGDEVNDISLLKRVGFAGCPSTAANMVKDLIVSRRDGFVCENEGGDGAVREFAELILRINGSGPFWPYDKREVQNDVSL